MSLPANSQAIYLFCFARSALLPGIEGTGVDGQNPLFLLRLSNIAAVISEIPLEEFCGPEAENRLQDLSWVGPRVCRHEEVVERVMSDSPVLPVQFGTIFSSVVILKERLEKYQDSITKFLDEVDGLEEWAVKGLLDKNRVVDQILALGLAAEAKHLTALPPGMRYFQEKKIKARAEEELKHWLSEICEGLAKDLKAYTSDFCQRKVLSRDATGSEKEMVLNWAFLVSPGALPGFQEQIDEVNRNTSSRGLVFEVSGPWPPYSFSPLLEMEPEK